MNVGFQPTDIVISPDGNEAYVLNSDSESISVINTITGEVVDTISLLILNPPPPK
jgi:YVTN family beta-propeller protein